MSFMDEIRKIPPVTRFLCAASLAVTLPVLLQLVHPYKIIFVKEFVTQKFEVSHTLLYNYEDRLLRAGHRGVGRWRNVC